ncbi:MAG TPA: hypothetical protein VJK30_05190 [Coxiellaceae bacterium]|nr:MAG: hypothetical protein A3E81_00830 [Gammaproteobacteria bacterium RIFCSPHIGHO2_12_FULL_36_30]HLB56704.1 hypothetical protein [Coxiellaceae bacterium]
MRMINDGISDLAITDAIIKWLQNCPETQTVVIDREWLHNENVRVALWVICYHFEKANKNLDEHIATLLTAQEDPVYFRNLIAIFYQHKHLTADFLCTLYTHKRNLVFISNVLLFADRKDLLNRDNLNIVLDLVIQNSQSLKTINRLLFRAFSSHISISKESLIVIFDILSCDKTKKGLTILKDILHAMEMFGELSEKTVTDFLMEYLNNKNIKPDCFLEHYSKAVFDFQVFDLSEEDRQTLQKNSAAAWWLFRMGESRANFLAIARSPFSFVLNDMTQNKASILFFLSNILPRQFYYCVLLHKMDLVDLLTKEFEKLNVCDDDKRDFIDKMLKVECSIDRNSQSFDEMIVQVEHFLWFHIRCFHEFRFQELTPEMQKLFQEKRDKVYKTCRLIPFSELLCFADDIKSTLLTLDDEDIRIINVVGRRHEAAHSEIARIHFLSIVLDAQILEIIAQIIRIPKKDNYHDFDYMLAQLYIFLEPYFFIETPNFNVIEAALTNFRNEIINNEPCNDIKLPLSPASSPALFHLSPRNSEVSLSPLPSPR